MRLVSENLNESIKHLPGRSEEEIQKYWEDLSDKELFRQSFWAPSSDVFKEIRKRRILQKCKDFHKLIHNHYLNKRRFATQEVIDEIADKCLNESIKHLPGRSEEEIRSSLENLTLQQKFALGIENGFDWLVKEAIEEGVDVNAFCHFTFLYNGDPLEIACLINQPSIVKLLIEAGAYVTKDDINIAKQVGNKEIINLLKREWQQHLYESIKHLPGRTEQELQAVMKNLPPQEKLETGAKQGMTWLVKDAIAAGANVHANNDYSLQWASYNGHAEVVKVLLGAGANVHALDDWALRWTSYNGHAEVVKILLGAGAYVHAYDDWALRHASYNGHVEVVKMLLGAEADVHARNDEALRWASENGHAEVVKLLKQHGANLTESFDRVYENLLNESLNEDFNVEKIRTIIKRIKDKKLFLNNLVKKFNEVDNPKLKKYIASVIVVLFITSFALKNNQWADTSKQTIDTVSSKIVQKEKITVPELIKITNIKVPDIYAKKASPSLIENAINIQFATTSSETKESIKEHEKLRLAAYDLHDGKITIGWGHAEQKQTSRYRLGQKISEKQAEILFRKDITKTEKAIKRMFAEWEEAGIKIKITQNMFDAMVSMAYNMGITRFRNTKFAQHLKENNHILAAKDIKLSGISDKFPGLAPRREQEYQLFVKDLLVHK